MKKGFKSRKRKTELSLHLCRSVIKLSFMECFWKQCGMPIDDCLKRMNRDIRSKLDGQTDQICMNCNVITISKLQ